MLKKLRRPSREDNKRCQKVVVEDSESDSGGSHKSHDNWRKRLEDKIHHTKGTSSSFKDFRHRMEWAASQVEAIADNDAELRSRHAELLRWAGDHIDGDGRMDRLSGKNDAIAEEVEAILAQEAEWCRKHRPRDGEVSRPEWRMRQRHVQAEVRRFQDVWRDYRDECIEYHRQAKVLFAKHCNMLDIVLPLSEGDVAREPLDFVLASKSESSGEEKKQPKRPSRKSKVKKLLKGLGVRGEDDLEDFVTRMELTVVLVGKFRDNALVLRHWQARMLGSMQASLDGQARVGHLSRNSDKIAGEVRAVLRKDRDWCENNRPSGQGQDMDKWETRKAHVEAQERHFENAWADLREASARYGRDVSELLLKRAERQTVEKEEMVHALSPPEETA